MKKIIILLALSLATIVHASERSFEALVRTPKHKAIVSKVILEDLISEEAFDGKYFKIVKGKGEEAIRFDEDYDLTFRAATAYFHLTLARNYFVQEIKSEYAANLAKMVIRIEHTNQFSELGHFAHDNLEPQYNNALTIPAGKGLASRGVKPWGMEIWFRPAKRVHLNDIKVNDLANKEFQVLMSGFRKQIHMQSLQRFLADAIIATTQDGYAITTDSVIRTVGASIIMEAGYHFIDPISKLFTRKWYWLDTALVPEVIYHEYAHAALSDYLVLSHSTAIIEGMADFFAGQIAHSPVLAKNIKKYNTYNGKNALKKKDYMIQFESTDYANTDFVFGLLWEMKKIVGEDKGEAFMYELRKQVTTNSSIRGELIDGLLNTCDEMCKLPFNDKLRILKALNSRKL